MLYEHAFKFTLITSLLIHGLLLYQLPQFKQFIQDKPLRDIRVNYYKIQSLKLKREDSNLSLVKMPAKDNLLLVKKENPPPQMSQDAISIFKKIQLPQNNQASIKQLHPQKKIVMPEVKSDTKIKNPKYNSYSQAVRGKIRRCAYENYTRHETGEVYLVFVVLKDGSLKEAKVIDDKTKALSYLKEIALRSVKDAAPYPAFPKELSYPELSFNVIISFEISE